MSHLNLRAYPTCGEAITYSGRTHQRCGPIAEHYHSWSTQGLHLPPRSNGKLKQMPTTPAVVESRFGLACDACGDWFHVECLGINEKNPRWNWMSKQSAASVKSMTHLWWEVLPESQMTRWTRQLRKKLKGKATKLNEALKVFEQVNLNKLFQLSMKNLNDWTNIWPHTSKYPGSNNENWRNKYQVIFTVASDTEAASNPQKTTQVVTRQTNWNPEASVVINGTKNGEKSRDSVKIKTEKSKCFKQMKIKSVMHSGQVVVEVGDKIKTEETVAKWQPDLFKRTQCRQTRKPQTNAVILNNALYHIRCIILVY